MIRSDDHVQVSVPLSSEDEGRAFYCGVCGLWEIPKPDGLPGRDGFLGRTRRLSGSIRYRGRDRVDDLEYWRKKLTEAACAVRDGKSLPGMHRFEFRDPFGNRMEFLEKHNQTPKN